MSARTPLQIVCAALLALLLILPALVVPSLAEAPPAETPTAAPAEKAESGPVEASEIRGAVPSRAVLMAEIRSLLDEQKVSVAKLRKAFDAAETPEQALQIQRQIEETKRDTEVAILRAQIPYVKAMGNQAAVERLENAVRILLDPSLAERHESDSGE